MDGEWAKGPAANSESAMTAVLVTTGSFEKQLPHAYVRCWERKMFLRRIHPLGLKT